MRSDSFRIGLPDAERPPAAAHQTALRGAGAKGRILLVEDDDILRESMFLLLKEEGYELGLADNGLEALSQLKAGYVPDVILLDLKMPVMDGWTFRMLQKDDPTWGQIPVVAISADGSATAAAISADAYLRKPIGRDQLLETIERVLVENRLRVSAHASETERLASLGRIAAAVGHEINNPLAFLVLNLDQSLEVLRSSVQTPPASAVTASSTAVELEQLKARLSDVVDMLEDCRAGSTRIRDTINNLQRLSRHGERDLGPVDIHKIIDQSVSMVWNQIRHRARLLKTFGQIPPIRGDGTALGQVILNLLVNAVQAMPEGDASRNEIRISTSVATGDRGPEVVVEVEDTGKGMDSDTLSHIFEPFFTTKAVEEGTGLGLSISRQTVIDHGGRLTVESKVGKGSVFRAFLPLEYAPQALAADVAPRQIAGAFRGRVLVIDDEPLIGRVIRNILKSFHEVTVVERADEALARFERGETFDVVLCDVVMPELSGPELHAAINERWPDVAGRMVFMTGGAFTPRTAAFLKRIHTDVLLKPFGVDSLRRLVEERVRGEA